MKQLKKRKICVCFTNVDIYMYTTFVIWLVLLMKLVFAYYTRGRLNLIVVFTHRT